MKYELRKVSPDWVHPTDADGRFIPLVAEAMPQWTAQEATAWQHYEAGTGTPVSPVMTTLVPLSNWVDLVQQRVEAALASSSPLFVNEVAAELAELTHFETLGRACDCDNSQARVQRHASALVNLLHHQRQLLKRSASTSPEPGGHNDSTASGHIHRV